MSLSNTPTPHIRAEKGEITEVILLPGDLPEARYIAEHFLEDMKRFNETRDMFDYAGIYMGRLVSIMGTGMGCPPIGIYPYEPIRFYDCENLIRMGTTEALAPDVHVRDMVLTMGAYITSNFVCLSGLSGDYSPVYSYNLLEQVVATAREQGLSLHMGNVFSSDMFYTSPKQVQGGMAWVDMGVLAAGTGAAALYVSTVAAGVSALAVLTISNSVVTGEATSAMERETSFAQVTEAALSLIS